MEGFVYLKIALGMWDIGEFWDYIITDRAEVSWKTEKNPSLHEK